MTSPASTTQDTERPFMAHLEDFRRTLIGCLAALSAGMAVALPLAPHIFKWLTIPLSRAGRAPDQYLKVFQLTGGLSLAMSIILWSGLLLSAPFMLLMIARFIFPALTLKERRSVVQLSGLAVVLFAIGVAVGYFWILGVTLQWMFTISAWMGVGMDFIQAPDYVSFVIKMLLAFGLAFEFPVVILFFANLGMITAATLAKFRRHVVIVIFLLSAIVTPTVDPLTQTLLALPLYLLYEFCIGAAWMMERRRSQP
jgi:sec-independent protein translocase protein TatC